MPNKEIENIRRIRKKSAVFNAETPDERMADLMAILKSEGLKPEDVELDWLLEKAGKGFSGIGATILERMEIAKIPRRSGRRKQPKQSWC